MNASQKSPDEVIRMLREIREFYEEFLHRNESLRSLGVILGCTDFKSLGEDAGEGFGWGLNLVIEGILAWQKEKLDKIHERAYRVQRIMEETKTIGGA